MGNNRYSSQNMKNFDFDDDEQVDEAEVGLDVADENFAQVKTENAIISEPEDGTNYRRGSQKYKDRVTNLRLQSKESYQRENMAFVGPTYFTQVNVEKNKNNQNEDEHDDEFEIFERAHEHIYS